MLSISQCIAKLAQIDAEIATLTAAQGRAVQQVTEKWEARIAEQRAWRDRVTTERDRLIGVRAGTGDYVVERYGQYLTRNGKWDASPDSFGIRFWTPDEAYSTAREYLGATVITKAQFEEAQYALRDQMKKNA